MAENKDNNITSVMEALVKGAESVFTTKTVVGEATKIDDTINLLSKIINFLWILIH